MVETKSSAVVREAGQAGGGQRPRDAGQGFLPITSLTSHPCISNSYKKQGECPRLVTRAKVTIRAGEEITLHYSTGLKGRLFRRSILNKVRNEQL